VPFCFTQNGWYVVGTPEGIYKERSMCARLIPSVFLNNSTCADIQVEEVNLSYFVMGRGDVLFTYVYISRQPRASRHGRHGRTSHIRTSRAIHPSLISH